MRVKSEEMQGTKRNPQHVLAVKHVLSQDTLLRLLSVDLFATEEVVCFDRRYGLTLCYGSSIHVP